MKNVISLKVRILGRDFFLVDITLVKNKMPELKNFYQKRFARTVPNENGTYQQTFISGTIICSHLHLLKSLFALI
jgi:hypothetical protein